jgi:hypothetical protein
VSRLPNLSWVEFKTYLRNFLPTRNIPHWQTQKMALKEISEKIFQASECRNQAELAILNMKKQILN